MNAMLAVRRILGLTVLLATGAAQAMATACPMGLAGNGDHPMVHFGSAHAGAHNEAKSSGADIGLGIASASLHAHRTSAAAHRSARVDHPSLAIDGGASRVSVPASRAPLGTGVPCALMMSCAPLIPAPRVPLSLLGRDAEVVSPPVSTRLLSAEIHAPTPPPRLLA